MAIRTATQLRSDATAADSALTTAIATPTVANIEAAITAYGTVVTNGRDSHLAKSAMRSDNQGSIGKDLASIAAVAVNDLRVILRKSVDAQGNVDPSAKDQLRLLQRQLNDKWASLKSLPTTS